jgi:hypothetical protein
VGGKATVDNIQLRCRAHNRYEADLFYGPMRRDGDSNPPVPERVDLGWIRSPPRDEGASPCPRGPREACPGPAPGPRRSSPPSLRSSS